MRSTEDYLSSVLTELATAAAMGAAYPSWKDDFARKEVREVWTDQGALLRRARYRRVTVAELDQMTPEARMRLGFGHWDEKLTVIPLWVFNYIADGEVLTCIDGSQSVKGRDEIDLDVRFGCITYGFHDSARTPAHA